MMRLNGFFINLWEYLFEFNYDYSSINKANLIMSIFNFLVKM